MRALVFGVGTTGLAVARAVDAAGWDTAAVDERLDVDASRLPDGVSIRTGPVTVDALDDVDVVLPSPGVPPTQPLLAAAVERGVPVWSEPELAVRLNGGATTLLAVTGTNGKTTTTEMLAACVDAPAAGNIGRPLIEVLAPADDDPPPLVVAELSSFQLHFCSRLRPAVAALLNIADDHLDWHGGAVQYAAAKAKIWGAQRTTDTVVANTDDPGVRAALALHGPPGDLVEVTAADDLLDGVHLAAGGPHNRLNALVAGRAALAFGRDPERVRSCLAAFHPGPHRLEHVATIGGVTWVNDSKATNPHAALAALRSYDDVVWIAGGLDKDLDFAPLAEVLPGRVRGVLTIGECGPAIAKVARAASVPVQEVGTLDVAVTRAAEIAVPGSTVLLAPAAASMDQFHNYAARGDAFRALVEERG